MKNGETLPIQIVIRVSEDQCDDHSTPSESIVAEITDLIETADVEEVITGHHYTQIPARCPDCHAQLSIEEIATDGANGASAPVRCQDSCGWRGIGEYRLIDILDSANSDERSLVASGRVTPRYYPY